MSNNLCLICNQEVKNSAIFNYLHICKNCYYKLHLMYKKIKISNCKCLILYEYNDFLRNIIVRIKGYKDIELARFLIMPMKLLLKIKYLNRIILPAPSTESSNKKRGFNHVEEIFKGLNFPIIKCFYKTKNYKQSEQNKYTRVNVNDAISIDSNKLNKRKKYLLVDDITTTHNTIKACINLLRNNGINNIKVLIIASSQKYL